MTVTAGIHRHAGAVRPAVHGRRTLLEANLLPAPAPVAPFLVEASEDPLLSEIMDLLDTLRQKAELHTAFHSASLPAAADRNDNFEALAWIETALEDVAAAAIGISRSGSSRSTQGLAN